VSTTVLSSAKLRLQVASFIADCKKTADESLIAAGRSSTFQEIYQVSLATHTVLGALATQKLRPRLHPARSVSVRIPFLVAVGQARVAEAELRRFVELISWAIYFSDHPVEWRKFNAKISGGFSQDGRRPISYASHRELSFYLEYAHELMEDEPSGLGAAAVESVKQSVRNLNAAVHAGRLAREVGSVPPHDVITEEGLRNFGKIQRSTFSGCCVLLAAYRKLQFNNLNAMARAHFDWLVGAKLRRDVRMGPFGLSAS
jgi:hypothetical protein